MREEAYHITAASNVPFIAAEGFRTDRRGVLGTGAYFDLGSESTGWGPARQRYPGRPLVVFSCQISPKQVLDLDDEAVRSRFRRFQRHLARSIGRDEMLALGQGGHVDLFLDILGSVGETYDAVKPTFVTDGHSRIAVRDARCILVLRVRDEQGNELPWPPPGR